MGQKVNPIGFRLGITSKWRSRWYARSADYGRYLIQDVRVRDFLFKKMENAAVGYIDIERPSSEKALVVIHTARPGVAIGRKGEDVKILRSDIAKLMGLKDDAVKINIEEIRVPEANARLTAQSIAQQLERRVMYRRAMRRAVINAMRVGAKGVKVNVAGRLNGAEIARSECYREGRVPLHTLRADIDYGYCLANTTYGVIGVKVWICRDTGDFVSDKKDAKLPVGAVAPAPLGS